MGRKKKIYIFRWSSLTVGVFISCTEDNIHISDEGVSREEKWKWNPKLSKEKTDNKNGNNSKDGSRENNDTGTVSETEDNPCQPQYELVTNKEMGTDSQEIEWQSSTWISRQKMKEWLELHDNIN